MFVASLFQGHLSNVDQKTEICVLIFEPLCVCYIYCNTCWNAYLGTLNTADYCDESDGQEDTGAKRTISNVFLIGKKNMYVRYKNPLGKITLWIRGRLGEWNTCKDYCMAGTAVSLLYRGKGQVTQCLWR